MDDHADVVRAVCRYIETNLEGALNLKALGRVAGLSPHHLQRTFKKLMGISPRQYADACRLGKLKERLRETNTVTTAMLEAGYGSSSRLYERAATHLGMTPGAYRKGGKGMSIRYTVSDSPLGRLLLAGTDKGVSALYLGDGDAELEAALKDEYPSASIRREDGGLGPWLKAVLDHLRGRLPHLDLPLDVRATAFQWRVWQALRQIPYGDTRTYTQIAEALGQPTAARAVARACATNPVSIVVPCHRVVRGDGDLAGYRWGVNRKKKLLAKEQEQATGP